MAELPDDGDRSELWRVRVPVVFEIAARSWAQARGILRPGGRLVYFAGGDTTAPVAPEGSTILEVLRTPVLESAGALVIMTRQ